MHKRFAWAALAVSVLSLAASCGRDSPDKAHGMPGGARLHGENHLVNAEVAFLFPDGNDRGWSHLRTGETHHAASPVAMSLLPQATRAKLIHQLDVVKEVIRKYPTVADAEAAGYRRAGPFRPSTGAHFGKEGLTIRGDTLSDDDLLHPIVLIYAGIARDAPIAGLMYMFDQPADPGHPREPEGFAGPNDHWHYHSNVCSTLREDGTVSLLNVVSGNEKTCTEKGGRFLRTTGYGIHVWPALAYANPLGIFAHSNPAITCADGLYFVKGQSDTNICVHP